MSSRLESDHEDKRARAAFYRRMHAAEKCPIPGPCFECGDTIPHHCALGTILRWEPRPKEALALAIDSVLYDDDARRRPENEAALSALRSRLCAFHRKVLESLEQRTFASRTRESTLETERQSG